jgi:hypothetical protein
MKRAQSHKIVHFAQILDVRYDDGAYGPGVKAVMTDTEGLFDDPKLFLRYEPKVGDYVLVYDKDTPDQYVSISPKEKFEAGYTVMQEDQEPFPGVPPEELMDREYNALQSAEWHAIVARGNIGFRFGPYTGVEIGKILQQSVDEGIPLAITGVCGQEFDWELARDMFGKPAKP